MATLIVGWVLVDQVGIVDISTANTLELAILLHTPATNAGINNAKRSRYETGMSETIKINHAYPEENKTGQVFLNATNNFAENVGILKAMCALFNQLQN